MPSNMSAVESEAHCQACIWEKACCEKKHLPEAKDIYDLIDISEK